MIAKPPRARILQLGTNWTGHNNDLIARFVSHFEVISVSASDLSRGAFIENLKCRKWGDFDGIIRPVVYQGAATEPWDEELISALPESLQIYASVGAGYDWMNIPLLTKRGIIYCNSGAACTTAVADTALYLIISVFRHFTTAQLGARTGDPNKWTSTRNIIREIGHNPINHVVGIVGLGRIGHLVAQKARFGLNARIVYHDIVRASIEDEKQLEATYHEDLDSMLAVSDCVVVCMPYFGEKVITKERFAKCKKGSRFVIVSRGLLMDEKALVEALQMGHISAAGLDVYENEPHVSPELLGMENVTMLPHCAGGSVESTAGFERLCVENLEAYFSSGGTLTAVNPEARHGVIINGDIAAVVCGAALPGDVLLFIKESVGVQVFVVLRSTNPLHSSEFDIVGQGFTLASYGVPDIEYTRGDDLPPKDHIFHEAGTCSIFLKITAEDAVMLLGQDCITEESYDVQARVDDYLQMYQDLRRDVDNFKALGVSVGHVLEIIPIPRQLRMQHL